MTPQQKSSGVKGRTVWNEKTRKYRTVFDVPADKKPQEPGVAEDSVEEGWKGALAGAALAGLGALSGAPAQAADLSNFNTQYLQQVVSGEHSRPMVSVDDARAELQARADGKQQAAPARPAQSQASAGYSKEWLQKAADPNRTGRYMISVEKAQELLGNMQEGVAEGSLNELSKNTLKSYSRERGTTIHQDQRDADRARDTAADKKKHGNTKSAADWEDEASWLDKRAEKGAKGVAQAAIKIAKKDVAEGGPYDLPGKDYDRPGDIPRKQSSKDHNPYPYSPEEDDDYFREIFRKKREANKAKAQSGSLNELSTQKLAQYKTAAAADAKKADAAGNYARGDRRFRGINQATIKQFANDAKTHTSTVKEQSSAGSEAVEQAILKRIMVSHTDLLRQFGPEKVMQAAEEVAYNVGDVDEIGTSDVSAYVRQVRQILGAE